MRQIVVTRAFAAMWIILAASAVLAVAGCLANPIREAQTLEQKAFATYGEFVIYEELAANLVQDPAMPANLKAALAKADAVAKPIADNGLTLIHTYDEIAAQVNAGTSGADKLAIATADLQSWINQATPAVKDLIQAVKQVRK